MFSEDYEKRIEICRACQDFDDSLCRCKVCGCLMKIKARLKSTKCPKNKWL